MKLKSKKVLVTGGAGFIGSHLVKRLLKEGCEVAVTVKYKSIFDSVRLASVWDQLTVIEADLRNTEAIKGIKDWKPDVVFHLAAYNHVGDSFSLYNEPLDSNARSTANLLQGYQDFEKFVYTSTSEVYGYQTDIPFVETMQPFPTSPYSVYKYTGELYARMMHHVYKLPISILRPFNTFGPWQSEKAVIPELIIKCLKGIPVLTTKGEQTREFNYVSDTVNGFLLAATQEEAVGKVLNIGNAEEIPIKELVEKVAKYTETESKIDIGAIPYRPTEIWRMKSNSEKGRKILGWKPEVTFDEGLKKSVEWYREYLNVFDGPKSSLAKLQ